MSDKPQPTSDGTTEIDRTQFPNGSAIASKADGAAHYEAFKVAHQNDVMPSDARLVSPKPGESKEEYFARVNAITSNKFELVDEIEPAADLLEIAEEVAPAQFDKEGGPSQKNVVKPLQKLQYQEPKLDTTTPTDQVSNPKPLHTIEYVASPSDSSRPVHMPSEKRAPMQSIHGFVPERNDHLNFVIQTYPNVSQSDINTLKVAIDRIPQSERKLLNASGVSFALVNTVSDARPELKNETTRVASQKFDATPGFFEPDSKQIVLALTSEHVGEGLDSGAIKLISGNSQSLMNTINHEVGHALDAVLKVSEDQEFIDACNEDILKLIYSDWGSFEKLSYYLKPELSQTGQSDWENLKVGRQEMFAQMYSATRCPEDELGENGKLLKEKFPRVFKFMEKMLRSLDEEQA